MNNKNLKLFLEHSRKLEKKNIYKSYLVLFIFFIYTVVASLYFKDFLYLCVFSIFAIGIMLFVPIDIRKNNNDNYNLYRDSSLLYFLFLVEWNNIVFYSGLSGETDRVICILLIVLSQLLVTIFMIGYQKYLISKNCLLNFKKFSIVRSIVAYLLFGAIIFLPIFATKIKPNSFVLFFGNSIISVAVIFSIVRVLFQAYAYRKLINYS